MGRAWQGTKARRFNFTCMGAFLLAFAGLGLGAAKGCAVCTHVCLDEIEGREFTSA